MAKPRYHCGIEAVVDLVGGKWKMLILFHLCGQQLRFSELRKIIENVSEKMLSQQLKEMVADRLLHRIDYMTVPPHVEYRIAPFGQDLCNSLRPVCEWGTRNMIEIEKVANARSQRQTSTSESSYSMSANHNTEVLVDNLTR